MTVREEVIAHIVEVMSAADEQGSDPIAAAKAAFPGTPEAVLGEAFWALEEQKTEAWWRALERIIDGEIIQTALLKQGDGT